MSDPTPDAGATGTSDAAGTSDATDMSGAAGTSGATGATDAPPSAIPQVSSRNTPRFRSPEQQRTLAAAFQTQGADYDRLRPGYPDAVIDHLLAALPTSAKDAVDLGAGTGKLSSQLARRGFDVVAVDPSRSMLEAAEAQHASTGPTAPGVPTAPDVPAGTRAAPGAREETSASGSLPRASGSLRTLLASAEETGLPEWSADLVTVAQAWHWFDLEAACREIERILRPGGVLALLWNSLDVQIPWVHRYSRIMHAGDVHKDDFSPPMAGGFVQTDRMVRHWEDPRTTQALIDLARTRSYTITAAPERREKVLANLDWYLHEHLGNAPGSTVGMPYRTDLFLFGRRQDSARDAV